MTQRDLAIAQAKRAADDEAWALRCRLFDAWERRPTSKSLIAYRRADDAWLQARAAIKQAEAAP